jgi:hypothetical protein
VFELHSENLPPNDVLLSLLGALRLKAKYPNVAPRPAGVEWKKDDGTRSEYLYFPQTGQSVGGQFLTYWKANGGLAQQGYPLTDLISERSDLDGKTYYVQYFERAVFEYHPENDTSHQVLLSQLGTFRFREKYGAAQQPPTVPMPNTPRPPAPTVTTQPVASGGSPPVGNYQCWQWAGATGGGFQYLAPLNIKDSQRYSTTPDATGTYSFTPATRIIRFLSGPYADLPGLFLPSGRPSNSKPTIVIRFDPNDTRDPTKENCFCAFCYYAGQ